LAAIRAEHERLAEAFRQRAATLQRRSAWLSAARLALFLLAGAALFSAFTRRELASQSWLAGCAVAGFLVLVVLHARLVRRQREAEICRSIEQRHLARTTRGWTRFPVAKPTVSEEHAYAFDIDLVGEGSLMQRIDVSHTVWGERTLLDWLSTLAPTATILERQAALQELAEVPDFRRRLELAGRDDGKLSGERFLDFVQRAPRVGRGLAVLLHALPLLGCGVAMSVSRGLVSPVWLAALLPQAVVVAWHWRGASQAFALLDTRQRHLEAFGELFLCIEGQSFQSPLLRRMRDRFHVEGKTASSQMRALASWAGWAELRFQALVHPFVNLLLMWDLHLLLRIESWTRRIGSHVRSWFETVGEFEALASLATLRSLEPGSAFPEIESEAPAFAARDLAQPLLPLEERVGNDLTIAGRGAFLILTGSNMAGKSTLLRSIGLNAALAFAGGPVCAAALSLTPARLRSSMRVRDSLQAGASYFYAEVLRIKALIADAAADPPILFLFDELLRGTNARERSLGARAIILHLVEKGALGIVATHDEALCELCDEPGLLGSNVHFTDQMRDGKMVFDFKLRQGRATGGNALAILEQAGIGRAPEPRVGASQRSEIELAE
jgi:hypothetical protein